MNKYHVRLRLIDGTEEDVSVEAETMPLALLEADKQINPCNEDLRWSLVDICEQA